MPEELLLKDVSLKNSKKELKEWIRRTIPVKGNRILWGQMLTGETRRKMKNGLVMLEGNDRNGQNEDPKEKEEEELEKDQTDKEVEAEQEDHEIRQERPRNRNQHNNCFNRRW